MIAIFRPNGKEDGRGGIFEIERIIKKLNNLK
jgi:hypothetical protein